MVVSRGAFAYLTCGMRAETDELFQCAWCGEPNEVAVDVSGGAEQVFVLDCQVCCRPNVLSVHIDVDADSFTIDVSRES
jgi:transcription elongation factor Elf1